LKPILDHVDGCSRNASPENLRFLCPNCDEQLKDTKGGANAGRIQSVGPVGYAVVEKNGDRNCMAFDQGTTVDLPAT
jgi:hypothetical protein